MSVVIVVVARTAPVRRRGVPVGRWRVVGRLGKLVLVLVVLLAQGVILGAQLVLVGGGVGKRLLSCLLGALLCGVCVVGLALDLLLQRLLVGALTLLVERFEMVRLRILPRLRVLAQAQVPVDDVGVIGLVQQLAAVTGAGVIGVGDLPALRAFVDVLRRGARCHGQQQGRDAQ